MRGSIHLAAVLIGGLGLACTTTVHVAFDDREDFSRHRTWDWLPHEAITVHALPPDQHELDTLLTRLVEGELIARGFERSEGAADFLVASYLRVQRELMTVSVTPATQFLYSLHSSPSYAIQATTQEVHAYERAYLAIVVAEGREQRLIWRGEFEGRFRGSFAPHLGDAVSNLLDRIPKPVQTPVAPQPVAQSLP